MPPELGAQLHEETMQDVLDVFFQAFCLENMCVFYVLRSDDDILVRAIAAKALNMCHEISITIYTRDKNLCSILWGK